MLSPAHMGLSGGEQPGASRSVCVYCVGSKCSFLGRLPPMPQKSSPKALSFFLPLFQHRARDVVEYSYVFLE